MKVVLSDDTELNVKANASLTHPKNEDLYKCIVCNSKVGNTGKHTCLNKLNIMLFFLS